MLSRRTILFLLAPWLVSLILFWLVPFFGTLLLSLTNATLFTSPQFSGLQNFRELFDDADFRSAMIRTVTFVLITVPITTAFSLFFALLLHRAFAGRDLFRAVLFLPWITSLVVIALVFTHLLQPGGYIFQLAQMAGLHPPRYGLLTDDVTAFPSIMAMDVWLSVGYFMMIFLAGLQSIPAELYEDARLCGAGRWQQFWAVTLPMLRPVAAYVIVINGIKSFQIFTEIYVMTKGKFETTTAVYYLYEKALTTDFRLGYASAAAVILFAVVLMVSIIQLRLISRETA